MSAGGRHLVLIGLMGAGKTTVGRRCAQRLERDFVDTDDVAVHLAGMPIEDLWAAGGEAAFRAAERDALAEVCRSPVPLVIASGGGTVVDADNRRRLRDAGFVVWLRAPAAVLADRVGDGDDRPLLRGDSRANLERLLALREPAYTAAADATVDTEGRGVEDVVEAVLDAAREVVR
jgi:shikimate kinase